MRVAIVSPVFPPYKGGIGAVAANDARLLRSAGMETTIFTPRYVEVPGEYFIERIKPLFAYGNAAITPSLFWRLRNFDLIHVHYPCYGMDLFAVLAGIVFRKPVIMTYHMKTYALDWRNAIFVLHRLFLEPTLLLFVKKLFVSSLDYATAVHIRHHALMELPFGVDTEIFHPEEEAKHETFTILFVGGLDKAHYFKGLHVLLKAVSFFSRQISYKLLIVGEGSERAQFEKLAKDYGVSDHVTFLGNVSREDLPRVYREADVHVLPSLDQGEAFGLVTLEAAASGIPSIVSSLPGVRMVVDPGVTGLRVPPGDPRSLYQALEHLALHPEERKRMGIAARKRALNCYDERRVAERLLAAYKEVSL